jgi:hypothetical protein
MRGMTAKRVQLSTRWEGDAIVVLDHDTEIDRVAAHDIQRVILVGAGDSPSDLRFAVIETANEHVVLPAASGIAGRVHFERLGFWSQRNCVYWASDSRAVLPRHLLPGVWLLRRHEPGYLRLAAAELAPIIEHWPLEGPQTWEQRKWARIVAGRSLASASKSPSQK